MSPIRLATTLALGLLLPVLACSGNGADDGAGDTSPVDGGSSDGGSGGSGDGGSSDGGSGDGGSSEALVTPDLPTEPGDHLLEVYWGSEPRDVVVTIPESWEPGTDQPLVLALHGGGSGAAGFRTNRENLVVAAAKVGAVLVFPEGELSLDGSGHSWNAWDKPRSPADDVSFLASLITWVRDGLELDPSRAYVSGFSNGAAMTQRFAAERPDMVTAAAAVCHSVWLHEPNDEVPEQCACAQVCSADCPSVAIGDAYALPTPLAPTPILVVRGGQDDRVCPDGGCSTKGKVSGTVEEQLQFWLTANGCDEGQVDEEEAFEGATLRRFEACDDDSVVYHVYDTGLGHTWASKYDAPVLSFLLSHP